MQKISIIVPVYNVFQYLEKCLTSLVEQTYSNIEIICVNDGSTDSSGEILDRFVNEDSRICVLSQKNSGPSIARNEGLKRCNGDYVLFVDADDYLEANACSNLVDVVSDKDVDVVGFSYKTFPNGTTSKYTMTVGKLLIPLELLSSTATPQASDDFAFVWRYMIRKEVLDVNGINFKPEISVGEDTVFMMEVFSFAKSVYLTDYAPYNYRVDNQYSIMHKEQYKPYLESSLIAQYEAKRQIIERNRWDELTPFSLDLADRAVKRYSRILMANRKAKGESKEQYIREVLSLPMMKDAMKVIGFRNIFDNWKEYIVFICMKFQFMPVLKRYF